MAKEVVAPDGRAWRVRRRWDPRDPDRTRLFDKTRRQLWARRQQLQGGDLLAGGAEGLGAVAEGGLVGLLVLLALFAVLLSWFVVVPLILAAVQVVVLVGLVVAAVVGRVLLRRPWIVEATDGWTTHRWEVVGWRASGDHARLVAEQLATGMPLPEPLPPAP
jgi:hypothetical protein